MLRTPLLGLPVLALSATLLAPTTLPAAADPPLTVPEARSQIAQLQIDAAAIDQDYVGVKEKLDAGKAKLATKRLDVRKQTTKVDRMRIQVGQVALAQFQNRNLDTTAQLFFTRDTDGFLSQMSTVEKVSENQNTVLQDFQTEQANLGNLERSAETDLVMLKEQEKELAKLRKASDTKIVESKAVLARLTEEERQAIAAEEARVAAEARKAAEKAAEKAAAARTTSTSQQKGRTTTGTGSTATNTGSTATNTGSTATNTGSTATNTGSTATNTGSTATNTGSTGTGRGATALAFARSQLGKPYRYAAAGPNAYDCSGLTLAAWQAAGISLARTSQAQFGNGRAVSQSSLQPGDLVFFYSGLSHVGLYAGNGMIIHSPRPGRSVEYIKMSYMPFAGARRPG